MICPVCESEYESGIQRCPDDDAALVERLDPAVARDQSEARFVLLHNFGSPPEAEMVNDIMVQNGIRSLVQSVSAGGLSPLLSTVAPGAGVLVDERDYDRARELYQAFFGDDTTPLTGGVIEGDDEEFDDEVDADDDPTQAP